MLRSNSRFYYRQASEYSKDSSSFFFRKLAFPAARFKKSTMGNEKTTLDPEEIHTEGRGNSTLRISRHCFTYVGSALLYFGPCLRKTCGNLKHVNTGTGLAIEKNPGSTTFGNLNRTVLSDESGIYESRPCSSGTHFGHVQHGKRGGLPEGSRRGRRSGSLCGAPRGRRCGGRLHRRTACSEEAR